MPSVLMSRNDLQQISCRRILDDDGDDGDDETRPDTEDGLLTRSLRTFNPPHPILQRQAVAFYNRQTIVQIFFRIPASQHKAPSVYLHDPKGEFPKRKISLKSVRLDRPKEPFHEMQLDTFFLPNTSAAQGRARQLQREGLVSGASSALRRVLVAVT
jgi:hypothetical protein